MRMTVPVLMAGLVACATGSVDDPVDSDTDTLHVRFAFPIDAPELIDGVMGVDHDALEGEGLIGRMACTNYDGRGFPACYDGHDGSDFLLDGGFDTMDAGSPTVLAAAAGVVITAHDGEYDRCHATLSGEIDCNGGPIRANYVEIAHEGGAVTRYLHLMKDSVAVQEGQTVAQGTPLGRIGSSGNSSVPHLHFELQVGEGVVVDPYAGPYSQPESWWCDQGAPHELPGPCP